MEAVLPDEFAGRGALVTAAAGAGIGQATARRLAAGGAQVVVTDIHEKRTHQVAEAMTRDYPETTVLGIPMDAGDRDPRRPERASGRPRGGGPNSPLSP